MSDFDNPWKEVLEHFFRPFLAFFFPERMRRSIGLETTNRWTRNCSRS